jgi:hypothetical protein
MKKMNDMKLNFDGSKLQWRIRDFKLWGAVKKIFGVFRVKNHDFTPKNHIFSNFRGRPPLDPPLN